MWLHGYNSDIFRFKAKCGTNSTGKEKGDTMTQSRNTLKVADSVYINKQGK